MQSNAHHPSSQQAPSTAADGSHSGHAGGAGHYGRFALMLLLSFACMYALMYAMVDRFSNVVPNINQFYMAALMTAPMAILELALMGAMYRDKRKNAVIFVLAGIVLLGSWFAIRTQAAVGDREFLKSMVPHHASAILMCEQADLSSPDIKALCSNIIEGQQAEIAQMKALLNPARGQAGTAAQD